MRIIKCKICGNVYKETEKNRCEKCGNQEGTEITYTTENLAQEDIKKVWTIFEKEAIDSNTKTIKEDFFGFNAGTKRAEIWKWFNEHYKGGVMELMTPAESKSTANKTVNNKVYKNNNQSNFRQAYSESVGVEPPDVDSDMRKMQRLFSPLYSNQESLMINAMINNKDCCVSYSGNRMLINYVLPEIIATSMMQMQNVNVGAFMQQLINNAYGLYMIHKNNQDR